MMLLAKKVTCYNIHIERIINMKRIIKIMTTLVVTLLLVTVLPCATFADDSDASEESTYEVYNGFGELIGTFDSFEDAEAFISGNDGITRFSSNAKKICKFIITLYNVIEIMAEVVEIFTTLIEYAGNEEMMLKIIDIIVPQNIKEGLAREGKSAFLYGVDAPNPYPPHSYQGAMWVKNNTYYIVC